MVSMYANTSTAPLNPSGPNPGTVALLTQSGACVTQHRLEVADESIALPPAAWGHLQIAELVAIRTLIKLRVFDAIPRPGAISLRDLSRATGVQESLLGAWHLLPIAAT